MEWQDIIQTRAQTWKALEVAALLAIALVGMDWQVEKSEITALAAILVMAVPLFGIQIARRHRNTTEARAFSLIRDYERRLGVPVDDFEPVAPITFLDILRFRRSNTSLFIVRMHVVILLIGLGYFVSAMLVKLRFL